MHRENQVQLVACTPFGRKAKCAKASLREQMGKCVVNFPPEPGDISTKYSDYLLSPAYNLKKVPSTRCNKPRFGNEKDYQTLQQRDESRDFWSSPNQMSQLNPLDLNHTKNSENKEKEIF